LRFQYGYTLAALHKLPEAEEQLKKAVALDPDYAAPHFVLGQVSAALGKLPSALAEYELFIAHASMHDTRRDEGLQAIQSLKSAAGSSK
jgi:tetratricopeptide (TPR) repeat protein